MIDVVPELLAASHADNWPPDGRVICASVGEKAAAEILSLRAQVASLGDAVAAERERCADIADEECEVQIACCQVVMELSGDDADIGVCAGAGQAAKRIAAKIRGHSDA